MATMVLREGDEDGAVGHLVGELGHGAECGRLLAEGIILAIFYPFSQFCEIDVSLPSL